jgi:hypothetical protein
MVKMKKISVAGNAGRFLLVFLLLLWISFAHRLNAQDEPAAEEETEEIAEAEDPGLISSRISLYVTQLPGDSIELQAMLRAKMEGTWQKIGDAEIEFVYVGDEEEISLGKLKTNAGGVATTLIPVGKMPLNSEGYLPFAARFAGTEELEESEGDASILRARMSISPVKGDSLNTIAVKVVALGAAGEEPIVEAEVAVFVKRLFGRLKVGEGTTDENGEVEIKFPGDLTGDDKGNLFITARIEDFEEYGNLAANTVQPWGTEVSYKVEALPRSLWSPNPPLWMVLTFFVLMAAVWGHYAVIVYFLKKIKKAGSTD